MLWTTEETHRRLWRPNIPIPLKSVFGSSPWNPAIDSIFIIANNTKLDNQHNVPVKVRVPVLVTDLLSATAWSFSCAAECLAVGGSTALEVPSRDSDSRHQMAQTYRDYHFYMIRYFPGLNLNCSTSQRSCLYPRIWRRQLDIDWTNLI